MKIKTISKSYINTSGKIYDSEFINLANITNNKINFDKRTLFLTESEKKILNENKIENFNDAVYVFKYKGRYGVICDIPIKEYDNGNIKCHELVIPHTIQGMLSNLHGYNTEAAPILLGHNKSINYKLYIEKNKYQKHFIFNDIDIYVFCGEEATHILEEFSGVDELYVADGHHRLYTTSLSNFKNSVLSCLISFDYLNILPIHRIIYNIKQETFDKAKEFIYNRFEILPKETPLSKGLVRIRYSNDGFVVKLIKLESDAFWNNDIYRLNTQIISQAFRIFNTEIIGYVSDEDIINNLKKLTKEDVLIETYPIDKNEFIDCANNRCIMPPKATWFHPKFPSFLVFKQYK